MRLLPLLRTLALAAGLGFCLVLLWLWWTARSLGTETWEMRIAWNIYGEAMLEGVLFHIVAVGMVVVLVYEIKSAKGKENDAAGHMLTVREGNAEPSAPDPVQGATGARHG